MATREFDFTDTRPPGEVSKPQDLFAVLFEPGDRIAVTTLDREKKEEVRPQREYWTGVPASDNGRASGRASATRARRPRFGVLTDP